MLLLNLMEMHILKVALYVVLHFFVVYDELIITSIFHRKHFISATEQCLKH